MSEPTKEAFRGILEKGGMPALVLIVGVGLGYFLPPILERHAESIDAKAAVQTDRITGAIDRLAETARNGQDQVTASIDGLSDTLERLQTQVGDIDDRVLTIERGDLPRIYDSLRNLEDRDTAR